MNISCLPCVSIIILTLTAFGATTKMDIWEATNFNAVTHFAGLEAYYIRRLEEEMDNLPEEPLDPAERRKLKQKICERIFTSHFFRMHGVDWLNVEREGIRRKLKTEYRDTFYKIFHEYEFEKRCLPVSGYEYDYENPYRVSRIQLTAGERKEFVFACPAFNRKSGKIEEYSVSRVYDANLVAYSMYAIGARFIFSPASNGSLNLVAMAEESAIGWSFKGVSKVVRLHYALNRQNEELSETPDRDPVCSLLPDEKLRLCSGLFGAAEFRNSVRFEPRVENVRVDCEKMTISVGFVRRFIAADRRRRRFEEWVIGCEASSKTNRRVIYYAARGSRANGIFVFRATRVNRKLHVYNYYVNVAVVRSMIDEESSEDTDIDDEGERYLDADVEE